MLQILVVTSYEVGRYAQVAVIISIPVVILTVATIIWLHYRKKKQPDPLEQRLRERLEQQLSEDIHFGINRPPMTHENKESEKDVRYLQDMLQEKQLQIEFLQNQLSQRVRDFHDLESRENGLKQELAEKEINLQELKQTLLSKEEDMQQLEIKLQQHIGFLAGIQEQLAKGVEQLHRSPDKQSTASEKQNTLTAV